MGENVDDDWQMQPCPDIVNSLRRDKVILKNLPNGFSIDGLRSMCGLYGNIVHIKQPTGTQFAFVQYTSADEANNILHRFNNDNPTLNIIVEIAHDHQKEYVPIENDEYEFLDKPMMIEDNAAMRNVLDMNSRQIKGPFTDPVEINHDSLIQGKDYRNTFLLFADPTKEFLWDSNSEINVEFQTNNQRKIVHGRAILQSSSIQPDDKSVSSVSKSFSFNTDLLPLNLKCVHCPKAADKMCKNCNEPQCSLECHTAKHQKPAKADEKVLPPKTLLSTIPSPIEAEPLRNTVKITAVINYRLIFVRPAGDQQELAFVQLMSNTVKCAKDADWLKSIPSVGTLVLAKFDYYQRALVLKRVNDTHVAVAFIDFGNVEIRPFHELKVMPDDLKKHKRFATKIRLSKIEHDFMNEQAVKYLYNLMAHNLELSIKIEKVDGVAVAELKTSDKWVNQMVNSLNIEDIKVANIKDMSYRIFFEKAFQSRCGQNIDHKNMSGKEVIILNNSWILYSLIAFIEADNLVKFIQNDQRIQNICNYLFQEDTCYTPKTEECCVVRLKGRWYRAYCVEVCFDGFVTMHFNDYGNMQLVEVHDIRPIPDALLLECFAIEANCFSEHKEMSDDVIAKLTEQYPELSRHKISRMEVQTDIDTMGTESLSLYAWF